MLFMSILGLSLEKSDFLERKKKEKKKPRMFSSFSSSFTSWGSILPNIEEIICFRIVPCLIDSMPNRNLGSFVHRGQNATKILPLACSESLQKCNE